MSRKKYLTIGDSYAIIHTMTSPNLNDPNELAIVMEEVARLISAGYGPPEVAVKLNLRAAEIQEILQHPSFQDTLLEIDPDAEFSLNADELAANAREVLDFVNARMMDYIKRYDELTKSKNEAVAKAALDKLMSFTTLQAEAQNRELVAVTDDDLERFKETWIEIQDALEGR